ncbi:MAG: phosphoribosylamine--glycine ligase [Candidatus Marinimicrobia bacterium]|jgi:phosphoribosylamine--glycine ligase|nr:phosphoribosylamine--glycine ligase [Candidatus Neomarinimicrobiota bacterium]
MNIAIIGSGGREHALEWKLAKSSNAEKIFVLSGNGGTKNNVKIDVNNFENIKEFCLEKNVELIVVGPEVPLVEGIVDHFSDTNIKVFGPDKRAAMLENSKIFSKHFMKKYSVATADYWEFSVEKDATEIVQKLDGKLVLKYDGLAGGKGVFVCDSVKEAMDSIQEIKARYGDTAKYLIEEKLIGQEVSIIGITDGKDIQLLLPSQDHKQLFDGDKGPNTGGMGAYCPATFVDEKLMATIKSDIIEPTIAGIKNEKFNYKGVIYFGLMLTNDGPKVLEYNIRFGDPETEVILPSLKSDLLELILACFDGNLSTTKPEFYKKYFVDVVLASGGYPNKYEKEYTISGLGNLSNETIIFHAGTKKENGKILTNGGRVLNVVASGNDLNSTIEKVHQECRKISFKDIYYRNDIGKR